MPSIPPEQITGPIFIQVMTIFGGIAGTIAATLVAYWKYREKKEEKTLGLDSNPLRCGQHQEAIDTLKEQYRSNAEAHEKMNDRIEQLNDLALLAITKGNPKISKLPGM